MNTQEVLIANGGAIVLMAIILISRYVTRRNKQTEDRFFSSLVYFALAGAVLELLAFLIDKKPGAFVRVLNIGINHLIYFCTVTISIIWLWFVDYSLNQNAKRIRTIFLPFVVLWGILVLLLIPNIFTGFIFKITPENEYIRAPFGYVYYGFLFLCFIASFVVYIRFRIVHGEAKFFPIWIFLIPIIAACIIQAIFYGIAAGWLGCAIGITGLYLNIQSRFALIDGLTGLYNRAFIEHQLIVARKRNKKYVYSGIMLDIDYFKQINDTFGHSAGDEALRIVANILVKETTRDILLFRFAGDEFVILFKTPIAQKDNVENIMKDFEQRIRNRAKEFNENENHLYNLDFSFGHTIFDTNLPDDEFFRQMDFAMYEEKKKHHALYKKNER